MEIGLSMISVYMAFMFWEDSSWELGSTWLTSSHPSGIAFGIFTRWYNVCWFYFSSGTDYGANLDNVA